MEIKISVFNLNFVKTTYHSSSNDQTSLEINLATHIKGHQDSSTLDSVIPLLKSYSKKIILNAEKFILIMIIVKSCKQLKCF